MKFPALLLILFLLINGCVPVAGVPGPVTATPAIMPRLNPSPTPSDSTLPLSCQVTDLKVYVNETDGYCFAYPPRFNQEDPLSGKPGINGPALDNSLTPTRATFGVEIKPATGQTLQEQINVYLKEVNTIDPATYTWTQIQVDGETAWMVEPVPSVGAWRLVFLVHHGILFRLSYWPVDSAAARADVDDLTQTTLGSFAFLE